MGGNSSKHVVDTSYKNFLECVNAIHALTLSRQQRRDIGAFLKLLRPLDPHDKDVILDLRLQVESHMPISRKMYVKILYYFNLCESSLRQKFIADATLAKEYDSIAVIEKNPLF